MKPSIVMILAALLVAASATTPELRTFTSADGAKTFEGTLLTQVLRTVETKPGLVEKYERLVAPGRR